MKIRKKLIISNIMVILAPLITSFILLAVFVDGIGAQNWETMENIYKDDNCMYDAQSIMFSYEDTDDISNLENSLIKIGYHFSVSEKGKVIFSNITKNNEKQIKKALGLSYDKTDTVTISTDDIVVLKHNAINNDTNDTSILAVHTPSIPAINTSGMKWYLISYISFFLLILISTFILINILLSWWISRSILKPLKKLSIGSEIIQQGNFDFEIDYDKNNEIGQVCKNFDDMRSHLKDSVVDRLRYEKYRKELILGISHDLRTPLTSIKGYVEGLRDGIANTPEKQLRYYAAIETRIKGLENLVDNLSSLSTLNSTRFAFNLENTELNQYFETKISKLQNTYNPRNVFITYISSPKPIFVNIDHKEMDRVTTNIIENSIKYRTNTNSNLEISLKKDNNFANLRFKDDGPGVKTRDLNHLFDSFYRGDASRTKPDEGSGLGLAIVKQIIIDQGGKVFAENNNGLAIIIHLPIAKEEHNEKNINN